MDDNFQLSDIKMKAMYLYEIIHAKDIKISKF